MSITRLLYFSTYQINSAHGTMVEQLNDILDIANRNNEIKGITGALIFDHDWFVQILEGPRNAVWSLFEHIQKDERNTKVTLVEMVSVPGRHFSHWWMGCTERSEKNAAVFEPYLRNGKFLPGEMRSLELLTLLCDLAEYGFENQVIM